MTITLSAPVETGWRELANTLRGRDVDPAYRDAPVLDVYGRISKNPETGETEKVDRQLIDTLREVERRHARLGEVLRDDGESAWSPKAKRPGWQRLLTRLDLRKSDGVICWHTDRLMRQPRDLERLVDLGDRGVLVASCHGDYNLSSADDRFTLRVQTAAAAKESDSTSRRRKRKAQAMREAGKRSGGARPFGQPGTKNGVPVAAEQVDAERAAIAWAVRAHLDGVSLHAIAREWNARGLLTIYGNKWDPRTVAKTLRAGRNAGFIEHNGKVVGRFADGEPIITEDEWREIVAVMQARRRGRPVTERYLLSGGHLLCGICGRPMTGKRKASRGGGSAHRFYVCRKQGDGCGRISIMAERVEDEVRRMVVRVLSDPKHAKQMARRSAALATAEDKLATVEQTANELSRRLGEGRMDINRYDAAMEPLDKRLIALRAEVDALRGETGDVAMREASADEIAQRWDDPDTEIETKRAMVAQVAPRGIIVRPATAAQHASNVSVAERLEVR
ncbi:MAG: recombinase family protein [Nocardioidaceae bacterium]